MSETVDNRTASTRDATARKPYESPEIIEEEVFERNAILACGEKDVPCPPPQSTVPS